MAKIIIFFCRTKLEKIRYTRKKGVFLNIHSRDSPPHFETRGIYTLKIQLETEGKHLDGALL